MERSEFEQELRALIAQLDKEQEKLAHRATTIQQALKDIDRRRDAVRETLRVYCLAHALPYDETEIDQGLRRRFMGMSTKNALIEIAKEQGGWLITKEASRLLVRAGMFKDARNASGSIHGALSRSPDLFEKIGRGRYRLIARTVSHSADAVLTRPADPTPQRNGPGEALRERTVPSAAPLNP